MEYTNVFKIFIKTANTSKDIIEILITQTSKNIVIRSNQIYITDKVMFVDTNISLGMKHFWANMFGNQINCMIKNKDNLLHNKDYYGILSNIYAGLILTHDKATKFFDMGICKYIPYENQFIFKKDLLNFAVNQYVNRLTTFVDADQFNNLKSFFDSGRTSIEYFNNGINNDIFQNIEKTVQLLDDLKIFKTLGNELSNVDKINILRVAIDISHNGMLDYLKIHNVNDAFLEKILNIFKFWKKETTFHCLTDITFEIKHNKIILNVKSSFLDSEIVDTFFKNNSSINKLDDMVLELQKQKIITKFRRKSI